MGGGIPPEGYAKDLFGPLARPEGYLVYLRCVGGVKGAGEVFNDTPRFCAMTKRCWSIDMLDVNGLLQHFIM